MTLPSHLILLTDRPDAARPASGRLPRGRLAGRARRVVVPAVVARPRWLVSGDAGDVAGDEASPPEPRQWAQRRLAFFAGHVPRLFISPLRYLIWKQIRNLPGVTAISHTLDCSIAAYAVCAKPRKLQFAARAVQCAAVQPCTCRFVDKCRLGAFCSAPKPHGICDAYKRVNFTNELRDVVRDTRLLSPSGYFAEAMKHRFCVAAPGDYWSVTKLTDAIAAGGAGGCIPLIVLPRQREAAAAAALPYADTLDYCSFAFLITNEGASTGMRRVLERLRATTAVEAEAKLHALRQVRAAFVWSARRSTAAAAGSSGAVDHLLSAACSAAQQLTSATSNQLRRDDPGVLLHRPTELLDTEAPVDSTPDGFVDVGASGRLKIGGTCILA